MFQSSTNTFVEDFIVRILAWAAAVYFAGKTWNFIFSRIKSYMFQFSKKRGHQVGLMGFTMSWTIENFTWELIGNLESSQVLIDSSLWSMELESKTPQWINKKEQKMFALSMKARNLKKDAAIKCRLSAVNQNGEKIYIDKVTGIIRSPRDRRQIVDFSSIDEDLKEELIADGTITFVLEVVFRNQADQLAKLSEALPDTTLGKTISPNLSLQTDLGNLFVTQQLSDLVIQIGDERLKAHKAVMAARCPSIASMFQDGASDITLQNVHPSIAEDLFRFVYTGEILQQTIDEHGENILQAANALKLDELKSIAERSLCGSITVENSSRRLILAHKCSSKLLRRTTVDFIKAHLKSVEEAKGYDDLKEYPEMLIELLTSKPSDF